MGKRRRIQFALEFSSGLFVLLLANIICFAAFRTPLINKINDYNQEIWINYTLTLVITHTIVYLGLASPLNMLKRSKPMEIFSTLRNCAITYAVIAVMLFLTKNPIIESRYLFVGGFAAYFVLSLIVRFVIKKFMLRRISNSTYATQTGIITTTERAEEFLTKLKLDWSKNIKAIALIDTELKNGGYYKISNAVNGSAAAVTSAKRIDSICGIPVVANIENLIGFTRTSSIDEVYINLPSDYEDIVSEMTEELEDMGITVYVNIPSLEKIVENSKFDNLNCIVKTGYPMAVFTPAVQDERAISIKRILDVIGGLVGCIVSLPIVLITAIPLLIESPGPLIFKQQRVGKNGRIFNIYKLRSMYVDAEERKKALMQQNQMNGFMFKMDDDPRITKVGKIIRKLSIDELPQFFNVLKGDMSLVGTRPPTIDEFEQYASHHKRRLSLKPGITGLWQVSGRSDIKDFEEVVKLDCEYIDNWSLWLDIKILFKTIGVVLCGKGAE